MTTTLVTSIGRTATKWLADRLNWPHEPAGNPGQMVSPAHLFRIVFGLWEPPEDLRVVVMTRDPQKQVLSIVNRWMALGRDIQQERREWPRRLDAYLWKLDEFVMAGAPVIRYEMLTLDYRSMIAELKHAGLPQPGSFSLQELNTFPRIIETLPPWAARSAEVMRGFYERWHAHDTRSASEDAPSRTTTSSPPRSQPCERTEPDSSKSS